MRAISYNFLIFFFVFCFLFISIAGCPGDDDEDDSDLPTATATVTPTHGNEDTPTLIPTSTPTPRDDETPTPTQTVTPTAEPETGTLNIWTSPVLGDIYVNGSLMGNGSWMEDVEPGEYLVNFGDVSSYNTPAEIWAIVVVNEITHVEGVYTQTSTPCYFQNIQYSINNGGWINWTGQTIQINQNSHIAFKFEFLNGSDWSAWVDIGFLSGSTSGGVGQHTVTYYPQGTQDDVFHLFGNGFASDNSDDCGANINIYVSY